MLGQSYGNVILNNVHSLGWLFLLRLHPPCFLESDLPNFQLKNLRFMLGGSYGYECTFKSRHVYKKKSKDNDKRGEGFRRVFAKWL